MRHVLGQQKEDRELLIESEDHDAKTSATKIFIDGSNTKYLDDSRADKKDHKNARASHGMFEYNSGKKKVDLSGHRVSRQASRDELVSDALDLMNAEEEMGQYMASRSFCNK